MPGTTMSVQEMTARLDEALAAWNRGDLAAYMDLYAPDALVHGYTPMPMDRDAVAGFYSAIFAGLPGSTIEVLDVFGSGDRLAGRFVQRGRHAGELMGVPATDRDVELNGITILAFRDGQVYERWASADMLGLMIQMGALPAPGGSPS